MESLNTIEIGRLYYRLCSFDQAVPLLMHGLEKARQTGTWSEFGEIIALLLRIRAERLEFDLIEKHLKDLDSIKLENPPSRLSYAIGVMHYYRGNIDAAETHFKAAATNARSTHDEGYGRFGLASCLGARKKTEEALEAIRYLQSPQFQVYTDLMVASLIYEAVRLRELERFPEALECLSRSQAQCQRESNVYMALNTMYGLAATYVEMQEFGKAQEYLNLLHQLVNPKDLAHLSQQVERKRDELARKDNSSPAFRLVEGPERLLFTPNGDKVDLKKQFVLVNLLKLLGEKGQSGVTKEEMVNRLWKEEYHPLRHDNKVHATILRLRKLIEPDLRTPQFILNAPDGYQLNPKVSFTVQVSQ